LRRAHGSSKTKSDRLRIGGDAWKKRGLAGDMFLSNEGIFRSQKSGEDLPLRESLGRPISGRMISTLKKR